MARPMPVLPDVGSITVSPGFSRPSSSACSIMASAIRSLMLPPGFARSSFIQTWAWFPNSRLIRRWGVPPMTSRMLFEITDLLLVMTAMTNRGRSRAASGIPALRSSATRYDGMRWNAGGEPHVAADDAVVADGGGAAEDRGVRVNHHAVLDRRMALGRRERLVHAQRAQRDPLIDLHVVPDHVVSPTTMPVPWSMQNDVPIVAPGWMSMPVRWCACSVSRRGTMGTASRESSWASR